VCAHFFLEPKQPILHLAFIATLSPFSVFLNPCLPLFSISLLSPLEKQQSATQLSLSLFDRAFSFSQCLSTFFLYSSFLLSYYLLNLCLSHSSFFFFPLFIVFHLSFRPPPAFEMASHKNSEPHYGSRTLLTVNRHVTLFLFFSLNLSATVTICTPHFPSLLFDIHLKTML
jgi:hypothetical protein